MVQPPPSAMEPRCGDFGLCGGCALQELTLQAQRRAKHDMLLRHVGPTDGIRVHPIIGPEAPWAYRNKVELAFGTRRYLSEEDHLAGKPIDGRFLGFHAPGRFDRVVDVQRCELVPENTNSIIKAVHHHLAHSALEPWDVRTHTGFWRHLVLRESRTGECLVAIYTAPPRDPELAAAELGALAEAIHGARGVVWFVNERVADAATGQARAVLRGEPFIHERLGDLVFRLSPTAFFQTNTAAAEQLYGVVQTAAGTGDGLLELYSGIGSLSTWLSPGFNKVVGVESNPEAVRDATFNARLNKRENVRFVAGEVEELLRLDEPCGGLQELCQGLDVVVADPPRAGPHPRVARWLAGFPAHRLVYLACHPPSLGRDRPTLEAGGWHMTDLWTVDMFPHTGHIEAVALFARFGQ